MPSIEKKKSGRPTKVQLTAKREMFCMEYIVDLNATQAAIRSGYSEKSANRIASQMLSKLDVQQRITELKALRVESVSLDAKYVLNRLVEIDSLDVIDILQEDGTMKNISDWPKEWRTSISGLDVQEMMSGDVSTIIKKIKWPDKLRNLELLGKHVDVRAWERQAEEGLGDAQPMTINFTVSEPVGKVKTTNAKA
ncbi:terminase small subunit [Paraglaciecola Antarctic JLT virus 2]|nr:terminase small subunit [Paraglaciecola Antarctic JLT virus 2]